MGRTSNSTTSGTSRRWFGTFQINIRLPSSLEKCYSRVRFSVDTLFTLRFASSLYLGNSNLNRYTQSYRTI